jgi:phosphoglycolate phosphatase-like HAD superfamily hydrolase
MINLCICDLDGIIVNSDARFARATVEGKINWKIAFNPELIELDMLIDGVADHLDRLENEGYTIVFLTSRPETMERATLAWLDRYELLGDRRTLITKPLSAQFVKTKTWKAERVANLIRQSQAQSVIFIDDEQANVETLIELLPDVRCFLKLDEAY